MYSKPYANKKLTGQEYIKNMPENNQTTLYALSADKRRVAHQRHEMGSERRPNQCKYWNLRPVVKSECSLIATRKSHAKHNQLVGRIPEHRQAKDYYAKDYKRSCFGSEIKGRNL